MSATLGDITPIARDLESRTGHPVSEVTHTERPIPLTFEYVRTPVHETVETLLENGQAPIYIVHFSQAAAMERARADRLDKGGGAAAACLAMVIWVAYGYGLAFGPEGNAYIAWGKLLADKDDTVQVFEIMRAQLAERLNPRIVNIRGGRLVA